MSQVKIIQKWNGTSKVSLQLLYDRFLAYLVDLGIKVVKCHNNDTNAVPENGNHAHVIRKNSRLLRKKQSIDWIERLLQTPLPEHRKYCIWRILAPYFINVTFVIW
jgi:hypothetical protein